MLLVGCASAPADLGSVDVTARYARSAPAVGEPRRVGDQLLFPVELRRGASVEARWVQFTLLDPTQHPGRSSTVRFSCCARNGAETVQQSIVRHAPAVSVVVTDAAGIVLGSDIGYPVEVARFSGLTTGTEAQARAARILEGDFGALLPETLIRDTGRGFASLLSLALVMNESDVLRPLFMRVARRPPLLKRINDVDVNVTASHPTRRDHALVAELHSARRGAWPAGGRRR